MKMKLVLLAGIGAIVGVILTYISAEVIHVTGDQRFCGSCHEMDPMVITYKHDVHGGSGKLGASASCVNCHLPQDSVAGYVYQKAKSGIAEVAVHFFGDPDSIDWIEHRKERKRFVFDSGCKSCHGNMQNNTYSSKQAQKMHEHYGKLQGTDKEVGCVQCHTDAGHKGMRNVLNYYKPEFEIYRYKMEDKKIELQKEHKDLGIRQDERKLKEQHVELKPTG